MAAKATLWRRATQPGEQKQLFRHIVIVYQQQLQPLLSSWICEHIRCHLRCSPPLQHRGSSWDGGGFRVSSGWKAFARHHATLPFLFSCLVPPGGGKKRLIAADKQLKIHHLVRPHRGENYSSTLFSAVQAELMATSSEITLDRLSVSLSTTFFPKSDFRTRSLLAEDNSWRNTHSSYS